MSVGALVCRALRPHVRSLTTLSPLWQEEADRHAVVARWHSGNNPVLLPAHSDDSSFRMLGQSSPQVFPGEAPDMEEQRKPVFLCPFWFLPTESMGRLKDCCFTLEVRVVCSMDSGKLGEECSKAGWHNSSRPLKPGSTTQNL